MDKKILENEFEISSVIDEFSYWIDQKELTKALEIMSEDAELTVIENGKTSTEAKGKQAIQDVMAQKNLYYDTIFHNNGTKYIEVKSLDQAATANTTCEALLLKIDPSSTTKQYMEYNDSLIKVNGNWYIVKRVINIVYKTVK